MSAVFYKPSTGYLADVIPFYEDGVFHLFYLHDFRNKEAYGEGTPWYRISTKDFISFEQPGEMIPRGSINEQDLYVYTGCVIKAGGMYHLFYTGHNPHFPKKGLPKEGVMHAMSRDMVSWEKLPGDTFYAPADGGYEPDDWRDPFIFFDEKTNCYHMLLAARRTSGPEVRRGCTAHCVSTDLKRWEVVEPLWAPELYYTHECPDLFQMGDWYYLIFSEFTDRCQTRYVMSRSLNGPWISPAEDTFDSRSFYAAKSCGDGKTRYLFGWNPTRLEESDDRPFVWGGNLTVHELYQRADGTLAVREPESFQNNWAPRALPQAELSPNGGRAAGDSIVLSRPDGYCQAAFPAPFPSRFRLRFDVKVKTAGTFGLRLCHREQEDASLAFVFDPARGHVRFDRMPNYHWSHMENSGLVRACAIVPGRPLSLTLVMEGTAACLYIGDEIAFSTRAYEGQGSGLSFFCAHGEVAYENISLYDWKE